CDEGVDLAADQHLLIGLVTGGVFEPQPSRRLERDVLGPGQHPGHLAVRYPEKLFENALHPYASRRLIALHADAAADEVAWVADASVRIHKHEAVPETAMGKDRQRDEGMARSLAMK